MPIVIPFLLLALLLSIVFLGQNLEPVVPIVLLGIRFPPLPLALWLVGALGLGLSLSLSFVLMMTIARRARKAKLEVAESEAWDDEDWSESPSPESIPRPPDIDAPFRVITPPMRKLDDDE